MYRLDHLNGPQRGRHRLVERRRIEAGSDLACQLWAPAAEGMAARHAEFEDAEGCVRVRALAGAPLRVNGLAVEAAELREGDRVSVGPLALRFSLRRRRWRDFRWLPPAALAAAAALLGGIHLARQFRRESDTDRTAEREEIEALRRSGVETAALLEMEAVAERFEASGTEPQERVREELEREREPVPPADPAPGPDDPGERRRAANDALDEARRLAAEGQLEPAAAALDRLLAGDPSFADARAERARLLERRDRPADALREWQALLGEGPESGLHAVAAGEVVRLGRALAAVAPPEPPPPAPPLPPPAPAPPPPAGPRLRIRSVEHRRFPASSEYEDMRILRIVVEAAEGFTAADIAAARVDVRFYDAVEGGSAASPTRARTTPGPLSLAAAPRDANGDWVLTATYVVPRGLRDRERRAIGRSLHYHGYLVQAFIGDRWQAAEARPPTLAERR